MSFEDPILFIMFIMLFLVIVMAVIRFLIGPSLPDRVVALDLLSTVTLAIVIFFAVATQEALLLNVATVMALTSFLGTIAFAYYIEQRRGTNNNGN